MTGKVLRQATEVLLGLSRVYFKYDLKLLEINPLSLTEDDRIMVVGTLINADDDALGRHADFKGLRNRTPIGSGVRPASWSCRPLPPTSPTPTGYGPATPR